MEIRTNVLRNSSILVLGATILAGCGGGSEQSFVDSLNSFNAGFADRFDLTGTPEITTFENLPVGDVSYNGFIFVDQIFEEVVAEADLTADFGASTISMTTSNYNVFDGDRILVRSTSGNLAMNNGVVDEDVFGDAFFVGTVTGSADGISYNNEVAGGFLGPNAEGVVGADNSLFPEIAFFAEAE